VVRRQRSGSTVRAPCGKENRKKKKNKRRDSGLQQCDDAWPSVDGTYEEDMG
jgi:hypothetical protein